jgi:hypothetical protein
MLIMIALFLTACGDTTEEPDVENDDPGLDEMNSVNLRNVDVAAEDLEVVVTGEASAVSDEFYYRVEEEGDVIVEEEHVTLDEPEDDWSEFELTLDLTDKYSNNEEPPVIVLYGKNSEGEMVNPNYIPIDL